MIELLVHALQALAAPADVQLARFPSFVVKADELALDFDEGLRLALDSNRLSESEKGALDALDRLLLDMSGEPDTELWTDAALKQSKEWAEVRRLASEALRTLGYPVVPPPPTQTMYVPGGQP